MKRSVIITGASRGLGLSLTKRFLAAGYQVFGVSRTRRYWTSAFKNISNRENLSMHSVNLISESAVKNFVKKVLKASRGNLEIVINNAGYGGGIARIEDLSRKEFAKFLDHNLLSAFLMCKYTVPYFRKKKRGLIVNVSSFAGKRAVPQLFAYSASKFGVVALSQCVAKENEDKSVKCISVCPGGMNTLMRADLFGKEDASKQQSPDFVADTMMNIIKGKVEVESGGDIVIRHGKITAINPSPSA